ncbi:branched-chain amino acid transaminase [Novosphingobium clariflavum]|uniref:Branched-chain-amino-acid aminotransferase n=1 Tax=Novosphingobium clariflavum TaxID=2029884 RepID=A0ABV6SFL4_9SPHN|nr:branched-chain amino acid transaminase [Novosphingobium clariflavum]
MTEHNYANRDGVIWFDGAFRPWREANMHVLTQGLHYASSVFEGERAYEGQVFRSHDHARRLIHSAGRLGMELPFSVDALVAAKAELLSRNDLRDAYVRPVVWRGSNEMDISTDGSDVHCAIAAWVWADPTPDLENGIALTVADWRRPPRSSVPTDAKAAGLYMISTMAKDEARRQGYSDAVMLDCAGRLTEATGANLFFVRNGALHTPSPGHFLNGIARQTVIHLAREAGIPVREYDLFPQDIRDFSECFLVGTAAEVTAVASIGGHVFTDRTVTRWVSTLYHQAVRDKGRYMPAAQLVPADIDCVA